MSNAHDSNFASSPFTLRSETGISKKGITVINSFINDIFERIVTEAGKLARRMAAGATLSYAAIKRALNAAATNTLDKQLDLERDSQRLLGQSADFKEGVAAFLAKRPANFTGR